jgi:hypothetical protein
MMHIKYTCANVGRIKATQTCSATILHTFEIQTIGNRLFMSRQLPEPSMVSVERDATHEGVCCAAQYFQTGGAITDIPFMHIHTWGHWHTNLHGGKERLVLLPVPCLELRKLLTHESGRTHRQCCQSLSSMGDPGTLRRHATASMFMCLSQTCTVHSVPFLVS